MRIILILSALIVCNSSLILPAYASPANNQSGSDPKSPTTLERDHAGENAGVDQITFAEIQKQLEQAESHAAFLHVLKAVQSSLEKHEFALIDPGREKLFALIERKAAYGRFYELAEKKVPCSVLRGLMIFGYAPRWPDIEDKALPRAVQEVIALIPSYCAAPGSRKQETSDRLSVTREQLPLIALPLLNEWNDRSIETRLYFKLNLAATALDTAVLTFPKFRTAL